MFQRSRQQRLFVLYLTVLLGIVLMPFLAAPSHALQHFHSFASGEKPGCGLQSMDSEEGLCDFCASAHGADPASALATPRLKLEEADFSESRDAALSLVTRELGPHRARGPPALLA